MERLKTNTPLDKILNGGIEKNSITNIYGPAGSGKTNIVLCAVVKCLQENKKVIYIDTESSFSVERFKQLGNNIGTDNIIFKAPHNWKEQHKTIKNLENNLNNVGLIIIDCLVNLYHLKLDKENYQNTNKQLATQYSILSKISREKNIPVIVTSQVYGNENDVQIIGNRIGRYWSKTLIELKKNHAPNKRTAILKKHRSLPEERKIKFEIKNNCLREVE